MSQPIRGRLAPSPSGALHIGNARSFLLAWLSARSQNGTLHLRIEDIDIWRNKPGAVEQAYDDLQWLGLDWDGEPVIQMQQVPAHQAALERLKAQELVYPCTCSRNDIAQAASAPHAEHEPPTYPGTCANRSAQDAETLTEPFAWRFRVSQTPSFVDGYLGFQQLDLQQAGGDFIVWRSMGIPAYQLAVVVDDAQAGITEVVRGDDLLTSTPRQLLLYEALGWPAPQFFHVPLVIGEDGRRLAKRHGDTRLAALREEGVSAEAVLGLLAWSCGWIPRIKPMTSRELLPLFSWDTIPKEPMVLTAKMVAMLADR